MSDTKTVKLRISQRVLTNVGRAKDVVCVVRSIDGDKIVVETPTGKTLIRHRESLRATS